MSLLSDLRIRSLQGDYSVAFRATIAEALESLHVAGDDVYLVCDGNVWRTYCEQLGDISVEFPVYVVEANEETKSLPGVSNFVNWLIEHRAIRSSTILAIGGGCIQDLVGFTAHIYYRGIKWAFMPTTLLAQADSCIGAKTGINVLPYKNQLGVLHSPTKIAIASEFLGSLPDTEIASGFGEILKLSVTSSRHFLHDLEELLERGGLQAGNLLAVIHASLRAKQEIIEEDEYETDLRRVLNYGHSFGHALEALARHKVPHGIAVLWGIDVINWLGVRWGVTDPIVASRLRDLSTRFVPYQLPIVPDASDLMAMLGRDKKVVDGVMNFAVLEQPGLIRIYPRPMDATLQDQISEYLGTDYVFRPC